MNHRLRVRVNKPPGVIASRDFRCDHAGFLQQWASGSGSVAVAGQKVNQSMFQQNAAQGGDLRPKPPKQACRSDLHGHAHFDPGLEPRRIAQNKGITFGMGQNKPVA